MKSEVLITVKSKNLEPLNANPGVGSFQSSDPRIVTTSWDDGSPSDLRIAEMLGERGLSGTFYVPVKGHYKNCRMDFEELRWLDRHGFEIGAHGVSHPNLVQCDAKRLVSEVEISKQKLEEDIGRKILMFAYPRGRYNSHVISAVKHAGFAGARTTEMFACGLTFDPFRMPTSLQAFPHPRQDYMRNLARVVGLRRTWAYVTHVRSASNWILLAKLLFDSVLRDGGVWHLYGHSWEIEEFELWNDLKEVLDYVSNRRGVSYLANGEVVNLEKEKLVALPVSPGIT